MDGGELYDPLRDRDGPAAPVGCGTRARGGRVGSIVVAVLQGPLPVEGATAQSPSQLSEAEAAVADTVLAVVQAVNDAWRDMDPERILGFFSEDVQYSWRGLTMPSRDAFEGAFHRYTR